MRNKKNTKNSTPSSSVVPRTWEDALIERAVSAPARGRPLEGKPLEAARKLRRKRWSYRDIAEFLRNNGVACSLSTVFHALRKEGK